MKILDQELETRFTFHPARKDQVPRYERIREWAGDFAAHIVKVTPGSREQSLAITHLEEVVFWANAAIARGESEGADAGRHSDRPRVDPIARARGVAEQGPPIEKSEPEPKADPPQDPPDAGDVDDHGSDSVGDRDEPKCRSCGGRGCPDCRYSGRA